MPAVGAKSDGTPFFSHLKAQLTHHVFLVGETDDFDQATLSLWADEGFKITYVPLGEEGSADFTRRLRDEADRVVGISERYIIVAFQDAADAVLSMAKTSIPRLVAVIAYYPSTIPDPTRTTYPPGLHVLMHTCPPSIGVERRPEVLGIQGKPKVVQKSLPDGRGVGQELRLGQAAAKRSVVSQGDLKLYVYPGRESGFAESDLDEYDETARNVAWSRSLRLARAAFGIVDEYGIEAARDDFIDDVVGGRQDAGATELEVNGRLVGAQAKGYYRTISAHSENMVELVSRTTGADQVVDELLIELKDPANEAWLCPPDGKKSQTKRIRLVSISTIRAGRIVKERVSVHNV